MCTNMTLMMWGDIYMLEYSKSHPEKPTMWLFYIYFTIKKNVQPELLFSL